MAKEAIKMPLVKRKNDSEKDQLVIRGGKKLKGEIVIRGAKNSIPKCMVAALLTNEQCVLHNVPDIKDVRIVSEMIQAMGGEVVQLEEGSLKIITKNVQPINPRQLKHIARKSRIPILFAGPLLRRFGTAMIPELGGCSIGPRPVDYHMHALEKLGATVSTIPSGYHITSKKLTGTKIRLPYPSVGTTEQVLLAAVKADGVTELSNAAVEPEIIDLISLLQKMGAIISVDIDRVITVIGTGELRGYEHSALPDRLEAASWACAALVTDGKIHVKNARQLDMTTFLNKYQQIGGRFEVDESGITFWKGGALHSIALETDVHPGFVTDWQQPFVVVLTQAHGASIVHETVYEERFGFVEPLNNMGAQIQLYRECLGGNKRCRFGQRNHYHSAVIMGPTALKGAEIVVPDLRAGFSYVIAALAAEGVSVVKNIDIINRGYENFIDKLTALGAAIDV